MTGKIISAEVFINGTKEFTYKLNNGQDITVEYDKYGLANITREALEVLLEVSTEGEEERAIQKEINSVLDKIKAEIEEIEKNYRLDKATKYGNKNAEQQNLSYSTMMMYEVADITDEIKDIIDKYKAESEE